MFVLTFKRVYFFKNFSDFENETKCTGILKLYSKYNMVLHLLLLYFIHNEKTRTKPRGALQTFIRSLLEQTSTMWHSSLTVECEKDLERVNKSALIFFFFKYKYKKSYNTLLLLLDLETLKERRTKLS